MQYSDTSTKQGLLQDCEFWTNLGDTGISGNATLKAQFTNRINRHYEKAMAKLGISRTTSGSDDTNYDNQNFSTFTISSGTHAYQFLTTEDGEAISDITGVLILPSATATEYVKLKEIPLSTTNVELILSPNASNTGVPTSYLERNNTVFFNCIPNYNATGKLFFNRVPSYFATTDTTKKPGFPAEYHQMLSLGASLDWLLVNKAEAAVLISRVETAYALLMKDFEAYARLRTPTRVVMRARQNVRE